VSLPVLVLGGGLTGLLATAELVEAGASVVLLERGPVLGGKRAARLYGDESIDPRLADIASNTSVEFLTLAELSVLDGEAGAFHAEVKQQPRYVTEDCTRCNHCVPVCPQAVSNEYDAGLTLRKAIHSPLPKTVPDVYAIDISSCLNSPPNYLPCQRCVEVCDDNAIHFDMPVPSVQAFEVAAVIVATGYADTGDEERAVFAEFGYGAHADIVSSVELQRLLEDPGPSGGFAVRPSDENYPDSVLLVMLSVERDAAWVMSNQLKRLYDQDVTQLNVLVLAADDDDAVLGELRAAVAECQATLSFGSWIGVEAESEEILRVTHLELPSGQRVDTRAGLVVLSSSIHPDEHVARQAQVLQLSLDDKGYIDTSRNGIYAAGGALGTVGIEAGAEQARAAVESALQHLPSTESDAAQPPSLGDLAQVLSGHDKDVNLEKVLYNLMKLGEERRQ
jgi:heterodisulfide reductase subunit A2